MKDLIALAIIFLVVFLPLTIIPIPIYATTTSYTWVYYQQYITPYTLLVPVLWQYNANGTNAQVGLISPNTLNYPYLLFLGVSVYYDGYNYYITSIPIVKLNTNAQFGLKPYTGITNGYEYQYFVSDTVNTYTDTFTVSTYQNGGYPYMFSYVQTYWYSSFNITDSNVNYNPLSISNPQYFNAYQINFPLPTQNTYLRYNFTYGVLTNKGYTNKGQITRFNYPNVKGILVPNLETILNGLNLPFQDSKGANVSVLPAYFKTRLVLAFDNYTSFAIAGLNGYNVSIYTTAGQYLTSYYPNANIYTAPFTLSSGFYYICISSGDCNPNQISSSAPVEYVQVPTIVYQNQTVYVPLKTALDINFLIYAVFVFFFLIAIFLIIRRLTL